MNLRTFLVYTSSKEINSLYGSSRIKYTIMTRGYLIVKKNLLKNFINRIFKTSLKDISIDIVIEQNKVFPELNYDRDSILRELENERFKCDNWIMCLSTNDPEMTAKINDFIKEVKDGKR